MRSGDPVFANEERTGCFSGHALAELVAAVLKAEGWVTKISPPGADGGVDILAGRGTLGLDGPRLCVQVKSQTSPCDVMVYRTLQGSMQTFSAQHGLLVCWGGFNRALQKEANQGYFSSKTLGYSRSGRGYLPQLREAPRRNPGRTPSGKGLDAFDGRAGKITS